MGDYKLKKQGDDFKNCLGDFKNCLADFSVYRL